MPTKAFKFRRITLDSVGTVLDNITLTLDSEGECAALRQLNQWNAQGNVTGLPLRYVYILEGF